jgi:hypothetical protein
MAKVSLRIEEIALHTLVGGHKIIIISRWKIRRRRVVLKVSFFRIICLVIEIIGIILLILLI